MKAETRYLSFQVPRRMDFLNITEDVRRVVEESGIREGLCLVNAMHITASVFINDDEPDPALAPFPVVPHSPIPSGRRAI